MHETSRTLLDKAGASFKNRPNRLVGRETERRRGRRNL